MYALDPIDEIQSHILGVITGLMSSYNLNPAQVEGRYEYVMSLQESDINRSYEPIQTDCETSEEEPCSTNTTISGSISWEEFPSIDKSKSWADYSDDEDNLMVEETLRAYSNQTELSSDDNNDEDEDEDGEEKDSPIFVSTRKQFCNTMQQGIKICPRYSSCHDGECKNFHIKEKNICQHVNRGSYCDTVGCELIVIRACRKGKKCKDTECSFRHR